MCHDYHADDGAPWLIKEQQKDKRKKPDKMANDNEVLKPSDKLTVKIRKQKIASR
jgi:hypothetical protein